MGGAGGENAASLQELSFVARADRFALSMASFLFLLGLSLYLP